MTVTINRHDLSFWINQGEDTASPPLEGTARADVTILGGGFAGLSAAWHLNRADPSLNIVLVESHTIGSGASGRSTGILRPGVGGSISQLARRYGEQEAAHLYQHTIDEVSYVKHLIRAEQLDCELEDVAHIKGALTRRQAALLRQEADLLARLGFEANVFDREALAALVPVRYCAGLSYPQSAQVNPARLCRELKRVIRERGVRICENTRVSAIRSEDGLRFELDRGELLADQAVIATNAYTSQLGLLPGQIVPIQTHVGVTRPLSDAQLQRLGWSERASASDKRRIFNYYRLTADNRIVFGGGRPIYRPAPGSRSAGATDVAAPRVWDEQHRAFARSFPDLSDVSIVQQWSGTVGMTLDELPILGELAQLPRAIFAGGWSGHGVAAAIASGAIVADLLLDRAALARDFRWLRSRAARIPGDPVRAVGLSAYLTALELADRLETWFDKLPSLGSRRRTAAPPARELIPTALTDRSTRHDCNASANPGRPHKH